MARSSKAEIDNFENAALPHLTSVYRAAVALCGRDQEAEDLVQKTFLRAIERFDSFERGTNCKAWLLRIMRNVWFDQLRHRKVVGRTVPLEEASLAEPSRADQTVWSDAHDLLENFSDREIIDALQDVPDQQRLTLYLVDVEQLNHAEVAGIMGVAVGTVKSRASRARTILKRKLMAHARDLGLLGRE